LIINELVRPYGWKSRRPPGGNLGFFKTIKDNILVDVLLRTIADGNQTKTTSPDKENNFFC